MVMNIQERAEKRQRELQHRQQKVYSEVKQIQQAVAAEVHPGMNRTRRRQVARAFGVFKYKGLWSTIFSNGELEFKTLRNDKPLQEQPA